MESFVSVKSAACRAEILGCLCSLAVVGNKMQLAEMAVSSCSTEFRKLSGSFLPFIGLCIAAIFLSMLTSLIVHRTGRFLKQRRVMQAEKQAQQAELERVRESHRIPVIFSDLIFV
eukprot:TRINITY_DN6773_c0_g1_i1.p1 TRINITY_DN6773_c0_g1~~TRINITY_DN6773_c0_g1_i1.p1  ORF type:complete len:116 (-),score=7.28 TRINITY_DN6773_c0_g1_i1:278-625(-)